VKRTAAEQVGAVTAELHAVRFGQFPERDAALQLLDFCLGNAGHGGISWKKAVKRIAGGQPVLDMDGHSQSTRNVTTPVRRSRAPPEFVPYHPTVPRKPAKDRGPRPPQGQHLLALRTRAGLTQIELARALGVSHANIAFWEWSASPPRSELLPRLAGILDVSVEELLGGDVVGAPVPIAAHPGPVGRAQRLFEDLRALPRRQQDRLLDSFQALLEDTKRRASLPTKRGRYPTITGARGGRPRQAKGGALRTWAAPADALRSPPAPTSPASTP
jgi:transcriptional regulator with XRE-family HTH domain